MPVSKFDSAPCLEVKTVDDLAVWLEKNHVKADNAWLILAKKSEPHYLDYGYLLDLLLCYGWIDGQVRRLGTTHTMTYICPRRKFSIWSRINKERVRQLITEDRMLPPGWQAIREAKVNGGWDRLTSIDVDHLPTDLQTALIANQAVQKRFNSYSVTRRQQIIFWVQSAKQPATRQRRITTIVQRIERHVKR